MQAGSELSGGLGARDRRYSRLITFSSTLGCGVFCSDQRMITTNDELEPGYGLDLSLNSKEISRGSFGADAILKDGLMVEEFVFRGDCSAIRDWMMGKRL